MNVPLLDLKAQYIKLKKQLDEAIIKTAESQYFILGPEVEKLENNICKYLNASKAIGVSSGTDALLIALMALEVGDGDEIILPTYSFFATAGVVARLNATPVFVDIDPVTFNIAPEKIEEKITSRTKAIIPVHLYGQSADMEPILEIAKKYNIKIIEDAAQAIGTKYKDGRCVGTIGDIGCFSFFPSKNLGGYGDGGMVVTMDEELGEKIKLLRVHGGKERYYHEIIGGNFRLDAIQAAVLNVKLPFLDKWSLQRKENAELYIKLFIEAGLSEGTGKTNFDEDNKILLPESVYKKTNNTNIHIFNQFVIRTKKRNELKDFLKENDIASEIYYPVPFHKQECFEKLMENSDIMKMEDFPNSDFAGEHVLALPVYPELTEEQIKYVVNKISEFFN